MLAVYPALLEALEIHRDAEGGLLLVPVQGKLRRAPPGQERVSHLPYRAEGYLLDYLADVDGARSRDDIEQRFNERYGPLFGPPLAGKCWQFVEQYRGRLFDVATTPREAPSPPRVTGSAEAYFPVHATLEIIETCNMTCDHCYYSSSPDKTGRMSLDDAIAIMDRLAAGGVRVIELTGGECTIHTDFSAILEHACRTFAIVAVLTNGYRLGTSDKLWDAVRSKDNLMVQVSLDAIGERHDRFRKHPRAYEAALRAIERVVSAGIICRVASSITEDNLDQVDELYRVVKALGVDKHSFAAVAPHGRGCNNTEAVGAAELTRKLNERLAAFGRDERLYDTPVQSQYGDSEPPHNCGAGARTIAVDQQGYVRACNFSRDSKKLGNLLHEPSQLIFGQQASFYFANAPSPGGRDCLGCDYYLHCRGCFVKAFMVSETIFPACPWRARWFPGMSLQLDDVPSRRASSQSSKAGKFDACPERTPRDLPTLCGAHENDPEYAVHPGHGHAREGAARVRLKVV
jgi:radical SAM protein with 4Fe4S-binding SPASM domain